MTLTVGLAGDTMLGRGVAERIADAGPGSLFAPELVEVAREADLVVLNLECAVSERGSRWPDPDKPFFFRAPPAALEALVELGVACVTLANNHALDYGEEALLDTFEHLADAGIAWVGAGRNVDEARAPAAVERGGRSITVIGVSDHPQEFAASPDRPGIALADLWDGAVPAWLTEQVATAARPVLVTPHWGPNMVAEPVAHVRRAAAELVAAGATFVAGHSAHVFHGVGGHVLFDAGDFIDDYATDPWLRNDLGLFFLVTLDEGGPRRLEAVPLELDYCHTRLAGREASAWIRRRFRTACAALGTETLEERGRVVVSFADGPGG